MIKTQMLLERARESVGLAAAVILCLASSSQGQTFRITSIAVQDDEGVVTWSGGVPTYQVQIRPGLDQEWVNVGDPTEEMTAAVSLQDDQAFVRVVSDFTALYRVVFAGTWSAETHPADFPAGSAHWSGLVGGVHDARAHFFREGETASGGIRSMAETGSKSSLLAEVSDAISAGTALFQLSGGDISRSPGTRTLTFPEPMNRDYPLVTLCSMIAPSPDWFVGSESVSLIEDDQWVASKVVTLYGNDAGTDSGTTYRSENQATAPRGVVRQFTGYPALVDGELVPFGTFTFTRID